MLLYITSHIILFHVFPPVAWSAGFAMLYTKPQPNTYTAEINEGPIWILHSVGCWWGLRLSNESVNCWCTVQETLIRSEYPVVINKKVYAHCEKQKQKTKPSFRFVQRKEWILLLKWPDQKAIICTDCEQ